MVGWEWPSVARNEEEEEKKIVAAIARRDGNAELQVSIEGMLPYVDSLLGLSGAGSDADRDGERGLDEEAET